MSNLSYTVLGGYYLLKEDYDLNCILSLNIFRSCVLMCFFVLRVDCFIVFPFGLMWRIQHCGLVFCLTALMCSVYLVIKLLSVCSKYNLGQLVATFYFADTWCVVDVIVGLSDTNSMIYVTRRFNAAITRAFQ